MVGSRRLTRLKSVDRKAFAFWKRFNIAGINGVYLRRLRVIQTPWFSIYWHHIDQPDPDLDPHDHPWKFWSIIIRGGYTERVYMNPDNVFFNTFQTWRRGSIHHMPTRWAHRITEALPGTVTLIIAGPRERVWGFWRQRFTGGIETRRKTDWIPWEDYVELRGDTAVRKKEPMP